MSDDDFIGAGMRAYWENLSERRKEAVLFMRDCEGIGDPVRVSGQPAKIYGYDGKTAKNIDAESVLWLMAWGFAKRVGDGLVGLTGLGEGVCNVADELEQKNAES